MKIQVQQSIIFALVILAALFASPVETSGQTGSTTILMASTGPRTDKLCVANPSFLAGEEQCIPPGISLLIDADGSCQVDISTAVRVANLDVLVNQGIATTDGTNFFWPEDNPSYPEMYLGYSVEDKVHAPGIVLASGVIGPINSFLPLENCIFGSSDPEQVFHATIDIEVDVAPACNAAEGEPLCLVATYELLQMSRLETFIPYNTNRPPMNQPGNVFSPNVFMDTDPTELNDLDYNIYYKVENCLCGIHGPAPEPPPSESAPVFNQPHGYAGDQAVKLYPNPVSDDRAFLHLQGADENQLVELEIFSSRGALVEKRIISLPAHSIVYRAVDLQNYPAGLYLVKINAPFIKQQFKLVRLKN